MGSFLAKAINWGLLKSPWIIHFNAGACNGCDVEVVDTLTPRYDMERIGVVQQGTPRHADILICTGAVTLQTRQRLIQIYEQIPQPKHVIAVGACACTGGVFDDCYCVTGGIDSAIPVDVYVPGCAARPEALLDALVKLLSTFPERQLIEKRLPEKQPVTEQPAMEQPATEQQIMEQPALQQPALQYPALQHPAVQQPAMQQPALQQPVMQQPVMQQPALQQPAIQQPVMQQPTTQQANMAHTELDLQRILAWQQIAALWSKMSEEEKRYAEQLWRSLPAVEKEIALRTVGPLMSDGQLTIDD